jgi:hypothetical protein
MTFVAQHRALLIFLGGATLIALAALLWCGPGSVWLLDLLAAIVAAGAVFTTGIGLILDAPHATPRRLWQAALTLSVVLCIACIAAAFADSAGRTGTADFLILLALELYLLGAAWRVAAARRRQFVQQHRVEDVGDFARQLFVTYRLFSHLRHPSIGLKKFPGGKPGLDLVRFVWWFPQLAPRLRAKHGIGIWRQFRDLLVLEVRHGLDTQNYYMFELYRSEVRARASGYMTRYETKNGLFKVLTWQLFRRKRQSMLSDKLETYRICQKHGVATVPILVVARNGQLEYLSEGPASLEQDLFLKPVKSKGSRGTEAIRYTGGTFHTEQGATLDRDGLIAYIAQRAGAEPILVQPRVVNHPGIADLADQALMRIRVVTILDGAGQPVITHAVLSNLCKLEINWSTDIELGAAIDLDSGALGMMTGDKADMWLDWSEDHPVTKQRVLGRVVPCWNEVRSISLAANAACNDRLLIGWDIAVGPDGAVLLEGNSYPDVDFLQRSHKCAIGDSPLGPLLYSRLLDLERDAAAGTLKKP